MSPTALRYQGANGNLVGEHQSRPRSSKPVANIQAGAAYLLMRAATFMIRNVPDPTDKTGGEAVVKIAKANATAVAMLKSLNPGSGALIKPGQKSCFDAEADCRLEGDHDVFRC